MHRIEILKGNRTYRIDINNCKQIMGKDIQKKFEIYYIIKNHFSKITNSESAIEERQKRAILFDEKPIDLKIWKFFEVTPFFDFDSDIKLGTKSLSYKYIIAVTKDIEYSDYFSSVMGTISLLNQEVLKEETKITINDKEFAFALGEISKNLILKEMTPYFSYSDNEFNAGDISYEENILFQLRLIEKIVEQTPENNFLVYCNVPKITSKIKLQLLGMKNKNLFLIIDSNDFVANSLNDLYLCGHKTIDFSNNEEILELIMELPFHIDKDELLNELGNIIFNNLSSERKIIYDEYLF